MVPGEHPHNFEYRNTVSVRAFTRQMELLTRWPDDWTEGWVEAMTAVARDEANHLAQVMRLLLSFLEDPQAPSAALTALAHRTDRKFIDHLLRKIGSEPSVHAKPNLKHVESFTWLKGNMSLLAELDDAGQHSAVQLIVASGMPRAAVFQVLAQLAAIGKVGGRRAAV